MHGAVRRSRRGSEEPGQRETWRKVRPRDRERVDRGTAHRTPVTSEIEPAHREREGRPSAASGKGPGSPGFCYDGAMMQSQSQSQGPVTGLFGGYPALPGTYDEMF